MSAPNASHASILTMDKAPFMNVINNGCWQYCGSLRIFDLTLTWTVFPVSGVIPSSVTIISNCFLRGIRIESKWIRNTENKSPLVTCSWCRGRWCHTTPSPPWFCGSLSLAKTSGKSPLFRLFRLQNQCSSCSKEWPKMRNLNLNFTTQNYWIVS